MISIKMKNMRASRSTILLTGFGPFPGVPVNVSGPLTEAIARRAATRFRSKRIVTAVLPTEWQTAPRRLAEFYRKETPALVLHFGVSERARDLVIETRALNRRGPTPDAAAARPKSSCIIAGGPDHLDVGLPVESIVDRLRAMGIPASRSDDAGSYLCNTVLYHSLRLAAAMAVPAAVGFVHIPTELVDLAAENPGRRLTWIEALAGCIEIIRTCLGLPVLENELTS